MSVYLDASVLLPTIVTEKGSGPVDRFMQASATPLLVSEFAAAEVSSALSRLARMGQLTAEDATSRLLDFDSWRIVHAKPIDVESVDVRLAVTFVRRFELKLRTPDALHLAICRRLDAALVTLDRRLSVAARELNIEVAFLEAG